MYTVNEDAFKSLRSMLVPLVRPHISMDIECNYEVDTKTGKVLPTNVDVDFDGYLFDEEKFCAALDLLNSEIVVRTSEITRGKDGTPEEYEDTLETADLSEALFAGLLHSFPKINKEFDPIRKLIDVVEDSEDPEVITNGIEKLGTMVGQAQAVLDRWVNEKFGDKDASETSVKANMFDAAVNRFIDGYAKQEEKTFAAFLKESGAGAFDFYTIAVYSDIYNDDDGDDEDD